MIERTAIGKVISAAMDKTIVVEIKRKIKHPFYGKYVSRSSKMYAHDDVNVCKMGDTVLIQQSRPLSKMKNWILVQVLEKAEIEDVV